MSDLSLGLQQATSQRPISSHFDEPLFQRKSALLGTPHLAPDPCLHLSTCPLREWNGLLFEDNGHNIQTDLAGLGQQTDLCFGDFTPDRVELHECNCNCNCNCKTFIEVTLENCLVDPVQFKVGNFVSCEELLLQYRKGQLPKRGAIWLTCCLHTMANWHLHGLTISALHSVSTDKTLNLLEFHYAEEMNAFERAFAAAQQAAHMETCA